MKYQINQIVYFLGLRQGELSIESLRVDKVEATRTSRDIFYSGECMSDPDGMPHAEYEKFLFSSQGEALAELQRQIDELKKLLK